MDRKLESRITKLEKALKIEDQAEASGDEKLYSAVYKTMKALSFVQFYLERKLR